MGNGGDLHQIGDADSKGVDAFGSLVGTVANFAGAATAVIQLAELIANTWSHSQSDLDQIKDAITEVYDKLKEHQKAADISVRLTTLDEQIGYAKGIADGLELDVEANLSLGDRNQRIESCAGAVEAMSDNAWLAPYADQIYWNDYPDYADIPGQGGEFYQLWGYGYSKSTADALAVAPDETGRVFSYTYVLPAYLRVLALLLAEIIALEPDRIAEWGKTVLGPKTELLAEYVDRIANDGIMLLSPSPWTGPRDEPWDRLPPPLEWRGYDLYQAMTWFVFAGAPLPYVGTPLNGVTPIYRQLDPASSDVEVAGVQIEYGAVDLYSGYSSMSSWVVDTTKPDGYILGPYAEPPPPPVPADYDPYRKLQLRLLKRARDVYTGIGLAVVGNAITNVRAVAGLEPLARPRLADWSFREICGIVGPDIDGRLGLRHVRTFVESTPVYDLPDSYWSDGRRGFRALLNV